jgi:two-component system, OmpR family, sensor histidine kinase SenX3
VALWTKASEHSELTVENAQLRSSLDSLREDFAVLAAGYDRLRSALRVAGSAVVLWDESGSEVFSSLGELTSGDPAAGLVVGRSVTLALQLVGPECPVGTESVNRTELIGPPHRTIEIMTKPIVGRDGFVGALAVVHDVSRVAQVESLRRDLVINVSHELRTPVGAMAVLAEMLVVEVDEISPNSVVINRLSHRMESESIRLARLVDDLLSLASASEGRPEFHSVEVADLIRQVIHRIAAASEVRGVSVRYSVDESIQHYVVGDRSQLVSALYNMVDNAIKYSDSGSYVDIGVHTVEPNAIAIEVSDQGIGIAMRDRERIFERFYRVDKARARDTGGTGLGLAIVRNVAIAHGGDVSVRSIEGQGSTFTLTLPRADATRHTVVPDSDSKGSPDV